MVADFKPLLQLKKLIPVQESSPSSVTQVLLVRFLGIVSIENGVCEFQRS